MRRWGLTAAVMALAVIGWMAAWRAVVFTSSIAGELDRASALSSIAPRPQATIVFDRHGKPAFSYFVEQRISVPLDRVSPHMVNAIIAVEDRRFYQHFGIDPVRIVGAAFRNLRAGRIVEGGSTITQQLARAAQLSPVRTYERKIREILVAARLEERYTKRQILEEYLNTVYFGEGYYGVEAASRGYFGKAAADLDPADAALLAALVRSPSSDAPCVSRVRATKRRNLVLALMERQGRLSAGELRAAVATSVPDASHKSSGASALAASGGTGQYFEEEVRRQLFQQFGADRVLRGGLRVYSTYDPDLQREAERAISARIAQIAASRKAAAALQGSLVAMSPADRRRLRAGRRTRFPREQLQSGDAGAPAGRLRVQADHLCGRARARLCAGHAAQGARHADRGRRVVDAGRRARARRVHAAARAQGVEQPRRRAAAAAGRHDHDALLRAAARHRVAAADGALAGARHRRGHAARADGGLQRLREQGLRCGAAPAAARRGCRRRPGSGSPTSITSRRSARPRPT